MACLSFRSCLMWWVHCAWFVTPVCFSAETHWCKAAAHCAKHTGLLWVNYMYSPAWVRPWWTCIKGFSELIFRSVMWIIWSRCECQGKVEVGVTLQSKKPPTIKAAFHVLSQCELCWKQRVLWGCVQAWRNRAGFWGRKSKTLEKFLLQIKVIFNDS